MKESWQHQMRSTLKGADACNDFFQTKLFKDHAFPIKIPLEFAKLIDHNNPNDPLLRQVISVDSLPSDKSFVAEPLQDTSFSPLDGLIHKYPNRVLLITTRVCAIHCQYCFRQNFDYQQHDALSNWPQIHTYISEHKNINEVILSGGDPLSLSDEKLANLIQSIEHIPHIKNLRIHSRNCVVSPSRITQKLCTMLSKTHLNVVLVLHVNHPSELSQDFSDAIVRLSDVVLLNQSVLLKGVNDDSEVLSELSLKLFDLGILPYYLHLLDKVKGAEHFLVADKIALNIHQQLKKNLSGYLVPKLVRDENTEFKVWV